MTHQQVQRIELLFDGELYGQFDGPLDPADDVPLTLVLTWADGHQTELAVQPTVNGRVVVTLSATSTGDKRV